ncbi:MAG: MoaD/ThiS family protein [Candidatus Bathyarchaeota archaeon]|nr:MAG: MoaD/ThiS family protein [Candidatus Bathyarchaeota archaeon]
MNITVELYGVARYLTQIKEIDLTLKDDASLHDLVTVLVERYPQLLGRVISLQTHMTVKTFKFNINGTYMADDLNMKLQEADHVLLFPIDGGG